MVRRVKTEISPSGSAICTKPKEKKNLKVFIKILFTTEHLEAEGTGLFQPGEEKASGGPNSNLPVPMPKLSR